MDLSQAEKIEFGNLCTMKSMYGAAAEFFRDAHSDQPGNTSFTSIRVAVLAGCGKGRDAESLDDTARARWRQQALDWVKADLTVWKGRLKNSKAEQRVFVRRVLSNWLSHSDLEAVRNAEALKRFPKAEREAWSQVWADVRAVLNDEGENGEP